MTVSIGQNAPDFKVLTDEGKTFTLSSLKGQKVILYFYPKADTSGCTKEACNFRDQLKDFQDLNAVVLGISKDKVPALQKFKAKYNLTFPLLSDESVEVCEAYNVIVEKSMYGKKYKGIERSTFLIDEEGKIVQIWRKVKIEGHNNEILKVLKGR